MHPLVLKIDWEFTANSSFHFIVASWLLSSGNMDTSAPLQSPTLQFDGLFGQCRSFSSKSAELFCTGISEVKTDPRIGL